jgi:fatty-acyl-CoA synthase
MKISFSTIGCPEWGLNEILATAKDFGYDGLEIRGIGRDIYAPDIREFNTDHLENTMIKIKNMGLEIPIFSSDAKIYDRSYTSKALKEAKDYIDLAGRAGVRNIRVLGDGTPHPENAVDQGYISDMLSQLCDYAADKSVDVLIETNGFLCDSRKMSEVIEKTNKKNAGIIWDIHHTFRYGRENPGYTMNILGPYIRHVHVKDSVIKDGGITEYRMAGYGDIPVLEAIKELKASGYAGYISLEWVKRWAPDLREPGIVFPHFKFYIDHLMAMI